MKIKILEFYIDILTILDYTFRVLFLITVTF